MQGWFNICKSLNVIQYISRRNEINQLIILIDAEKNSNKIQYHSVIKALMKLGIKGMCLNIIEAIHEKPIMNIILMSKS
jgi:GTP-binding protein EngB required for normal cell division